MENLSELYLELAEKINANINEIEHIDLWHNQVNFLEDEHRFKSPAVFLEFRTNDVQDQGRKVQQLNMQVNIYLFFETFLESGFNDYNKEDAVAFLDTLTAIHKLLHGSSGANYSNMRRTGFNPVDSGSTSNLYQMPYSCVVTDVSAFVESDDPVDEDGDGQNEFQEYSVT